MIKIKNRIFQAIKRVHVQEIYQIDLVSPVVAKQLAHIANTAMFSINV